MVICGKGNGKTLLWKCILFNQTPAFSKAGVFGILMMGYGIWMKEIKRGRIT